MSDELLFVVVFNQWLVTGTARQTEVCRTLSASSAQTLS